MRWLNWAMGSRCLVVSSGEKSGDVVSSGEKSGDVGKNKSSAVAAAEEAKEEEEEEEVEEEEEEESVDIAGESGAWPDIGLKPASAVGDRQLSCSCHSPWHASK